MYSSTPRIDRRVAATQGRIEGQNVVGAPGFGSVSRFNRVFAANTGSPEAFSRARLKVAAGHCLGHHFLMPAAASTETRQTDERGSWPTMIDFYRSGIDVSLIDANLKLSTTRRIEKSASFMRLIDAVRSSRPIAPAAK